MEPFQIAVRLSDLLRIGNKYKVWNYNVKLTPERSTGRGVEQLIMNPRTSLQAGLETEKKKLLNKKERKTESIFGYKV